jgi:hypothetical protein
MKFDMEKLYRIASHGKPRDLVPVAVKRSSVERKHHDIDTAFNSVKSKHVIHVGLRTELDILLYAILKALSTLFDRDDSTELYDYWPAIDHSNLEKAMENWKMRAEIIGNELVEWFDILKDLNFVKIYRLGQVVYFQLTPEGVFRIMQSIDAPVPRELISD